MFALKKESNPYLHIAVPVGVIVLCSVIAVLALKAGAVGIASFFAVLSLQAWGYLTFIALSCIIAVIRLGHTMK